MATSSILPQSRLPLPETSWAHTAAWLPTWVPLVPAPTPASQASSAGSQLLPHSLQPAPSLCGSVKCCLLQEATWSPPAEAPLCFSLAARLCSPQPHTGCCCLLLWALLRVGSQMDMGPQTVCYRSGLDEHRNHE